MNDVVVQTSENIVLYRRRSPRLATNNNHRTKDDVDSSEDCNIAVKIPTKNGKRKRDSIKEQQPELVACPKAAGIDNTISDDKTIKLDDCKKAPSLPRTIEESIRSANPNIEYVLGIDEAGRGPLAGPVVVAGIRMKRDTSTEEEEDDANIVQGVTDSKKITLESQRELLYKDLMLMFSVQTTIATADATMQKDHEPYSSKQWAIAVIDAATIDEINILQATMLGMRLVASVIMGQSIQYPIINEEEMIGIDTPSTGCYVITGTDSSSIQETSSGLDEVDCGDLSESLYFALIDGNHVPKDMPCPANAIVKGDSKEYCIAAASILAKVTRDRIMHQYDKVYPMYNFKQHKGYPTAAHVNAIREHGPCPIHRLTFAPLKTKVTCGKRKNGEK